MIAEDKLADSDSHPANAVTKETVEKLVQEFVSHWSEGDLVQACQVYAENAQHVVDDAAIYSRDNIIAHYRKIYPTPEDMGTLTLELLAFRESPGSKGRGGNAAFNLSIETDAGKKITGRMDVVYGICEGLVKVTQDVTYYKVTH